MHGQFMFFFFHLSLSTKLSFLVQFYSIEDRETTFKKKKKKKVLNHVYKFDDQLTNIYF